MKNIPPLDRISIEDRGRIALLLLIIVTILVATLGCSSVGVEDTGVDTVGSSAPGSLSPPMQHPLLTKNQVGCDQSQTNDVSTQNVISPVPPLSAPTQSQTTAGGIDDRPWSGQEIPETERDAFKRLERLSRLMQEPLEGQDRISRRSGVVTERDDFRSGNAEGAWR